jgi:hypothetical protein
MREIKPGVEVLYMSGYARPILATQGRLDPGVALVEKPFSEMTLLTAAGQALDGHSPRLRHPDGHSPRLRHPGGHSPGYATPAATPAPPRPDATQLRLAKAGRHAVLDLSGRQGVLSVK